MPYLPPPASRRTALSLALAGLGLIAACGSAPESIVSAPVTVRAPNPITVLEHVNNGAIYQANATGGFFQDERRPTNIGDLLKVDISDHMTASNAVNSKTSRDNQLASKGPGNGGALDVNATASGNDTFKGEGQTSQTSSFSGRIATQVINVLPNGHLLVAGEKRMAFNNGKNTLRFSGIVDPKDIKAGSVVASDDVIDARLEQMGDGEVAETSQRTWIQRLLTNTLTIW